MSPLWQGVAGAVDWHSCCWGCSLLVIMHPCGALPAGAGLNLLLISWLQEVYMKNHEIATHTLHHVADPGACSSTSAHSSVAACL